MEQIVYSDTKVRETYESLNEYADVAKQRGDVQSAPRNAKSCDFNGYTTFSQAIQMGRKGWDVEADAALNIADAALTRLREERIIDHSEATWDLSGAEVDVSRYLEGEPECMIEFPAVPQLRQGDVVTIVRQFAVSGFTNQEDIKRYGRLIAALVLSIEAMGLAAEVWLDATIRGETYGDNGITHTHLYQRIKVKGAADMLHAGQLMFGVAHPALLRQVTFGTMDGLPGALKAAHSNGNGRGKVRKREADEAALYPEGTIFFDAPSAKDDPVVFLVGELKKLGLVPEH